MPTQTITIPADIPADYEAIAFRVADHAVDYFLSDFGVVIPPSPKLLNSKTHSARLILRPAWKWPEFVKPGTWIAQNEDGTWHAFSAEPVAIPHGWAPRIGAEWCVIRERTWMIPDWRFPPCTDWRQSKRQKPLS